jgi:vitamin K-dependent gamma-carboxylase
MDRGQALQRRLGEPVDPAGLTALRVMLGLLFAGSAARFIYKGWIGPLFVEPGYHFRYPGFAWVPVPSEGVLYALFGVMIAAGLLVAAGRLYRPAALALLVAFSWVELIDVATYLNHYYLMSLLAGLLLVAPLEAGRSHHPRWALTLFRGQIAVVYVFAGLGKLNPDWLLRGEPLHTWLRLREDLGPLAPLLQERAGAVAMSWAGALYDLSVPLWLSWRPTRRLAWGAVVIFHVSTWLLFPIGVFPWVMIACSTVFWEPSWPRRLASALSPGRPRGPALPAGGLAGRGATLLVVVWLTVQVLLPLRSLLWPGQTLWTERGFRFSWRVMLVEKTGLVEYRLVERGKGGGGGEGSRRWRVSPRAALSPLQLQEMSTQPDLIVRYARHLAARWAEEQGAEVAVYADAWASLSRRPAQRLIDPEVDLTADALPEGWILPLEEP